MPRRLEPLAGSPASRGSLVPSPAADEAPIGSEFTDIPVSVLCEAANDTVFEIQQPVVVVKVFRSTAILIILQH